MLNKLIISLLTLTLAISGCRKFIEVDSPTTSTNAENVYVNDNTAAAVLTGIYTRMSGDFLGNGFTSLSLYPELSADNLVLFDLGNLGFVNYYRNNISVGEETNVHLWSGFYPYIYTANAAIEGVSASTTLTPAVKDQLLGEAHFVRGLIYFYLVNLYGDVPLALGTDYTVNAKLPRTPAVAVYQQIVQDLTKASQLLHADYKRADALTTAAERLRPNQAAAAALLARVSLYTGDYAQAVSQSSLVINDSTTYHLEALSDVFLATSKEAIWQLQPVRIGENTKEAQFFDIRQGFSPDRPAFLSADLISDFEAEDRRVQEWISSADVNGTVYPYASKYKVADLDQPLTEYSTVLRLAELLLIRAEARAKTGDLEGALADLNRVRQRAGLDPVSAPSPQDLADMILEERRHELFCEYGHRWFDLKRTGTIDAVMPAAAVQKGGNWTTDWHWYPVPAYDIKANANLTQNNGYKN